MSVLAVSNEATIVTVILVFSIFFTVIATLSRAAWILAKATISQLEAIKANTEAVGTLTGRVDQLERTVKASPHAL